MPGVVKRPNKPVRPPTYTRAPTCALLCDYATRASEGRCRPCKYAMTKYRNTYEARCAAQLGPEFAYEPLKLTYTITHTYLPDFVHVEDKRIVEAKGYWDADGRRLIRAVMAQNPDYNLEMWFQNPDLKISKGSATTYGDWCDRHGIAWRKGPAK